MAAACRMHSLNSDQAFADTRRCDHKASPGNLVPEPQERCYGLPARHHRRAPTSQSQRGKRMTDFPEQLPHGIIDEVFPDVFFVKGQIKIARPDTVVLLTRSMTVIRDGDDLFLVNTIRLDDDGLSALDQLGTVKAIVRIGGNHGRDDAFYCDRYDAPVWMPEGVPLTRPVARQMILQPGDAGLLADASVLLFDTTKDPEAVICLHRHGGILITADSFHHMEAPDEFVDESSAGILGEAGFFRPANIGPVWRKREAPARSDYDRILELPFQHLLPGHGEPLKDDAKAILTRSVKELF